MRLGGTTAIRGLVGVGLAGACNADEGSRADVGEDTETGESGETDEGTVRVARIEINPGVAIPIVVDGEPVGAAQRNAQIPTGRPALVRLHLDVSEDWTAREVELRLELADTQGHMGERVQTRWVDADTDPSDLETGFAFELGASEVSAGLELALELHDPVGDPVRMPVDGMYTVGVEDDPMRIRLMLVPVLYDSGNCVSDATPSEQESLAFGTAIFQTFPVQSVELYQRETPVAWNQELDGNWAGLLQKLIDLRAIDQVPDDMYYFGLVDFCDEDPFVSAAAAGFPAAGPEGAELRVAVASKYPTPQGDGGINGLMFGIGVLHGRLTVPCHAGAGLDEAYPYEGGFIGTWGYGVLDGELRDPGTYVDLVAGCMSSTRWTSDYTWRGLYDRVRYVTSWAE